MDNLYINELAQKCIDSSTIDTALFSKYDVQKGLRDKNGIGVLAGLTTISNVMAVKMVDGQRVPCAGKLLFRGYSIKDLVKNSGKAEHFGFEEAMYLILFGELPTKEQYSNFKKLLGENMVLPNSFTRDVIMKAPTQDIMSSITKSVLTLAAYDPKASDLSIENVLRQCISLIAVFPMLAVYGYHAYNHYERDDSLFIHRPDPELSTAENLLRMLRPNMQYTDLEARVLDAALILHMEHGGGNNSTFTTHVVSSSGSDTYSVVAAALSSLKGPKHGGANLKVVQMMEDLKANVKDITDKEQVKEYLENVLAGKAFDGKGLIYGMGHAIYSVSDPRAQVFKKFVRGLAEEKNMNDEFKLFSLIEEMAPELIAKKRKMYKGVSANVDFYSGFVYSMLGIPLELYTPIFAVARIVGWSAHRLEELINVDKIIRPAYKSLVEEREYIDVENRE